VTRTPVSRSKGQRSTCRGRGHIVAASRLLNYVNQAIAVYRRIVYHLFSSQLMEIRCIDSNCIRFYRCRQCWTIAKFGGFRARLPNNINVLILKPSPPSQSDSTCLSSVLWALSDQDKTAKLILRMKTCCSLLLFKNNKPTPRSQGFVGQSSSKLAQV